MNYDDCNIELLRLLVEIMALQLCFSIEMKRLSSQILLEGAQEIFFA